MREFQGKLYAKKSEIAAAITREVGKPVVEALVTEVLVVLDAARFLIDKAWGLLRDEPVPHGNLVTKLKSGWLLREPHGVIGIISPWNYPFSIPATETLAALVAGNAVVLKPPSAAPAVVHALVELFVDAGTPPGVLNVVYGRSMGPALVRDPRVDFITFTGSGRTGTDIKTASGLRRVALELGNNGPTIVHADGNLEEATPLCARKSFDVLAQAQAEFQEILDKTEK